MIINRFKKLKNINIIFNIGFSKFVFYFQKYYKICVLFANHIR